MYQQILQILHDSALIAEPKITELRVYGEERFRVKIRGNVTESLTLQIWINHNSLRTRYSYQLFGEERPIFRWDNAPHYPELSENFPHHFHDEPGAIVSSELTGNPVEDVLSVLRGIKEFLTDPYAQE
jgi:hypothetical protein